MPDVRVRLVFRNDMLQTLIDESGLTLNVLAEKIGVAYNWLICVKSMGRTPYTRDMESYSDSALKTANYFGILVEDLFPHEIYRIKWPSRLEARFPVERVAALMQSDNSRKYMLEPHEAYEEKEKHGIIKDMIDTLKPREQEVIRMRFGLGGYKPMSLEEVGQKVEVTRERIRQIEGKAIRKLRNRKLMIEVNEP